MFLKNNKYRRIWIILWIAIIILCLYVAVLLGILVDIKYLLDDRIDEIGESASEAMYRGVYVSFILFLSQTMVVLVSCFLLVRTRRKKQG